MRNFKSIALIAALAINTVAFAATDSNSTLTFTNSAVNNLSITGGDVERIFVGTGADTVGTTDELTGVDGGNLAWDTQQETDVDTTYQITVRLSEALTNFTGTVSLEDGNEDVALNTAEDADSAAVLKAGIARYTSGNGDLTYNFVQDNMDGFDNQVVTVIYSLIAE